MGNGPKLAHWSKWFRITLNKAFNWKAYPACIYRKFWRDCWQNFVWMLHFCVCIDLLHFMSLSTIYAVDRNLVAYCHGYIMGNEPKFADWSKWLCNALRSCFCSLLISFWEVTAGRCVYNLINFVQIIQNFVISLLIEDIETNSPIGKHTLDVFT